MTAESVRQNKGFFAVAVTIVAGLMRGFIGAHGPRKFFAKTIEAALLGQTNREKCVSLKATL